MKRGEANKGKETMDEQQTEKTHQTESSGAVSWTNTKAKQPGARKGNCQISMIGNKQNTDRQANRVR